MLTSGANEWKGNTQIGGLVKAPRSCRDNFGCGNDFDPIIIISLTLLLLTHPTCLDLVDNELLAILINVVSQNMG